jgi:hypothetical protein
MAHHLILINNHALLVPDEIPLSIHIHASVLVAHCRHHHRRRDIAVSVATTSATT